MSLTKLVRHILQQMFIVLQWSRSREAEDTFGGLMGGVGRLIG